MEFKKDTDNNTTALSRTESGMGAFNYSLSKKTERLVTAVYLVTGFLSDTEPLKARLRMLSLNLVRDAGYAKNGTQSTEANVLENLTSGILETLALLEVAFVAGLISEMNFAVLKREYVSLKDSIEVKRISRESRTDNVLGTNFFGSNFKMEEGETKSNFSSYSKGHSIGHTNTAMSDRISKGHAVAPSVSGKEIVKDKQISLKTNHSPRATTDVAKESRRARILKLVKDNREVTIKDIAIQFPDLSEKTIQRELVNLVEGNVLKKFGERRWSKYTSA